MARTCKTRDSWTMPAVTNHVQPNPVPIRQVEVGRVIIAAITFPLRLTLHWAFPSELSRPMAANIAPYQSRVSRERPVPGTKSFPSPVPGRVAHI
jgi:hypothetical protein